jgi:hypothetical protein
MNSLEYGQDYVKIAGIDAFSHRKQKKMIVWIIVDVFSTVQVVLNLYNFFHSSSHF